MFQKFAKLEVLEVKSAPTRVSASSLTKFADFEDYKTEDGFVYVRVRAISSRVNKNNDGWPSEELKKSYKTFIGKPIFVDHHNSDPKKARGVIVDAALHIEDSKTSALDPYYASAPAEHLPPTWIELLLEVDARRFPKLAKAIIDGDVDSVSMGANVELSKCSHCGNEATSPEQYCKHVQSKGAYFDFWDENNNKTSKKAYEDCYKIGFFEISFVFDPADETALVSDIKHTARMARIAAVRSESDEFGDFTASADDYGDFDKTAMGTPDSASRFESFVGEVLQYLGIRVTPEINTAVHNYILNQTHGQPPSYGEWWHDRGNDRGWNKGIQQMAQHLMTDPNIKQLVDQGSIPNKDMRKDHWDTEYNGVQQKGVSMFASTEVVDDDFGFYASTKDEREEGEGTSGFFCPKCDSRMGGANKCDNCGHVKGDGGKKEAAGAEKPQSDMTTAPTKVDTLRQEQICPICGSDMEDGVCEVCNYEEPPEGFDNPDLAKAKEVDEQIHQQDAQQAAQGQEQQPNDVQPQPGGPPPPMPSGAMPATSKAHGSSTVRIEDKTSAQQGGRINTQERPILPVTRQLTDKPIRQKTVSEAKKPVQSNQTKENMTDTIKTADGATAQGEGVAPEKRVDVEGIGAVTGDPLSGIEHENVEKDTGDFTAPHTDTWSGNEGDSLGQESPVTSDTGDFFTVSKEKVAAEAEDNAGDDIGDGGGSAKAGGPTWDSGDGGFPDHQPARVDLLAPLKEEVGESTKTDPNEQYRSLKVETPVTKGEDANSVGGPIGVAVAAAKAQVLAAVKLAETEVALGLTPAENKFDRIAELEGTPEGEINAQLETLARVKTAGLKKAATTSSTAPGRLPKFNPVVASFDLEEHSTDNYDTDDVIGW